MNSLIASMQHLHTINTSSTASPSLVQIKYYSVQVGLTIFRIDSRYQNISYLGDGSLGCVVSAYDIKNNRNVAIKKISKPFSNRSSTQRLQCEVRLLNHFNGHENIVNIYDIMVDPPDVPEFEDIYIVTNLYETSLCEVIQSHQTLTENHYQFLLYQTLRALKYIHSANVIHRDLKPSNILVNSSCDLAISDFGLGRSLDSFGDKDPLTQNVVELQYRAPELLCECKEYGPSVDVWSVGCIFAEVITRSCFFRGENPVHQLKMILNKIDCSKDKEKLNFIKDQAALNNIIKYRNEISCVPNFGFNFPDGASYLVLDLLKKMLHFNPEERITVDEALRHPFLKPLHSQTIERVCPYILNFSMNKRGYENIAKQIINQSQIYHQNSNLNTNMNQSQPSHIPLHHQSQIMNNTNTNKNSCKGSIATCHSSVDMETENTDEETASKEDLMMSSTQNYVIDQLMTKDTRVLVLQEVMKYRPISQQMMVYLAFGSNRSYY